MLNEAATKLKEVVRLTGRATTKGRPVTEFSVDAGFRTSGKDVSCITNADGYFDCYVPKGWSGKLTFAAKGFTFQPNPLAINNAGSEKRELAIEAIPV